jgi:WD40 repeat protein
LLNFDLRIENDIICNIDTNRAMIIALSSFKYKSYINSKRTFRILDVETNIKYSIIRIKNIENKSKVDIRNIIYSCLDQYNISRKCKLCNGMHNYPQLQQSYIPIICNNNEKLCIIYNKCVSDLAKKEHKRSIRAAVKAINWSPIHRGLLATGGGTADQHIRFWNTLTLQPL